MKRTKKTNVCRSDSQPHIIGDAIGYIVLAHCNFDDVLVGAYRDFKDASKRARHIWTNPPERHLCSDQASDTTMLHVSVYAVTSPERFVCVYEYFGPQHRKKTKVKS